MESEVFNCEKSKAGTKKNAAARTLPLPAFHRNVIRLNFEFFIANRILKSKTAAKKISRPVVRISVWAIAIGIVIMIIALATGNGLRRAIGDKVTGFGGDIQILNYQPNPIYEQSPAALGDSLLAELRARENVRKIQPFGQKAGIIKTDELFEGAVLKGVDSQYDWSVLSDYIKNGNRLHIRDSVYNDSILISQTLADKLELELHQRISMYFVRQGPKPPLLRRFYISGIYQTDFEEIDNNFLIGDLKHIQRLNKWDSAQVGGYEIFLAENSDAARAAQVQEIRAKLPYELDALSSRQLNEQLYQWLDLFDLNILIIILIMIVVATINMSIALLILILERTQMIGILKALGSANGSIRRIFLWNAGQLILRGLFWGNLIGIGLCLLQEQFGLIKLDPATYYVSQVAVDLDWGLILLLNLGTVAICVACLVLPSYLVTRISPVKAIRFD